MGQINVSDFSDKIVNLIIGWSPKLLLVIFTIILGLWIIRILLRSLSRTFEKSKVDISLQKFLLSLLGVILKILLFLSVASMIGIQTTSFIAILGAAGLALGLALQGSLANFAGGVLILFFKPFKVGDFIEAQGYSGTVSAIGVVNTTLKAPDNKTVILPNGSLSNGNITNFSTEPVRRVDMTFGVGYEDDIKKAKEILSSLVKQDSRVLQTPEPTVVVSELADSSVNFSVRVWCNAADYWPIYFDMQEKVKLNFDKAGLSIPYPQQDVHVYNH